MRSSGCCLQRCVQYMNTVANGHSEMKADIVVHKYTYFTCHTCRILPTYLHCMPTLLPFVTSAPLTPWHLPLQYLGDNTPPAVKQKLRELLIGWKEGLPLEPKIGECFEMLEKCGLITDPSATDTVSVCVCVQECSYLYY